MVKKKVARKIEPGTSTKKLSMKDLDERLEKLTALVEKAVKVQGPEVPEAPVEPEAPKPKELPPLAEGQTYIFCSGPAKEQKLRIEPGRQSQVNPMTGEYTLIPPVIVDFGTQDEETGPKGFHVISNATLEDLEEVKKIRVALKAVKTKEIVEVTGDPAFEYVVR